MLLEKRKKNRENSMILIKQQSTGVKKTEMLPPHGKNPNQSQSTSTRKIVIPNGQSFSSCYIELCKKRRLRPLPVICVTLPHSLDFTTDRVKMDDWNPILNALSLDHSLKSIAIRSRYQYRKHLDNVTSELKARAIGKAPVVLTRYLLELLSHSVSQCIRNSSVLTSLELEGIPLPSDCLAVLCVGLSNTSCLRHLSLFKCYIGDVSCEMICRTIVNVNSIRTLNLGQCDLSSRCASALATALSRQKLLLFHDAWKQSLRYREPNVEAMPGLRRLTLNGNPRLGDIGVNEILEAVVDSLWLKALDLQQCGLTDVITNDIMNLLNYNETLVVVDVRMNNNLQDELAQKIAKKLSENNATGKSEYKWFNLPKKQFSKAIKRTDRQEETKTMHKRMKNHCHSTLQKSTPTEIRKEKLFSKTKNQAKKNPPESNKQHLVLNLNTQLENRANSFNTSESGSSKQEEITELERNEANKIEIDIQEILIKENKENDLEDIRRQLEEARREYQLLLERAKQNEILLIKERIRRETIEKKLRTLQNNYNELESTLKKKEEEKRGYFLVSQNSLNEICSSFDSLMEILEKSRNSNFIQQESEQEIILPDDIRTKLALIIRKTKSESLRRGYFSEEISNEMKKYARSEADMRNLLPIIDLIHCEKNIGDNIISEENTSRRIVEDHKGDKPREENESFRKQENLQEVNNQKVENNFYRQIEERSRILRKESLRNKENYQNCDDNYETKKEEEEEDNFRRIIENLSKKKGKKIEINNPTATPRTKERARAIFIQIINRNMSLNLSSQ